MRRHHRPRRGSEWERTEFESRRGSRADEEQFVRSGTVIKLVGGGRASAMQVGMLVEQARQAWSCYQHWSVVASMNTCVATNQFDAGMHTCRAGTPHLWCSWCLCCMMRRCTCHNPPRGKMQAEAAMPWHHCMRMYSCLALAPRARRKRCTRRPRLGVSPRR